MLEAGALQAYDLKGGKYQVGIGMHKAHWGIICGRRKHGRMIPATSLDNVCIPSTHHLGSLRIDPGPYPTP